MAEEMVDDPRTWEAGYSEAIGGLRERMTQAPQSPALSRAMPGSMITPDMLMQAFATPGVQHDDKAPKEPSRWWHLFPGFSRGYAQRKQWQRDEDRLKLEKQRLAGQQAMDKLKRLEFMQKMEERQNVQRFAQMYGGLKRHQDVLDPEAVREIEGDMMQSLASAGDVEGVTKFEESRRADRAQKAMDAAQQQLDAGGMSQAPGVTFPALPEQAPVTMPNAAAAPPTVPRTASAGMRPESNLYARMIREEAQRQGVDPDLAVAVATQESSLNPQAIGDGGKAIGLFQLHSPAAQDVGLTPDERSDVQKNIRGGVGYLKLKLGQTGGDVDKALLRYNGGGDPNYVQNVRSHLPKSVGMRDMVAGPGAPAPAQPQQQPAVMGPGEAMARDRIELARLKQREAQMQSIIQQNLRYGDTKAGKARLDLWKDQREQLQEQIKRLDDKLTTNVDSATGIPRAYLTPEATQAASAKKRREEIEDFREKERIKTEMEPAGAREKRQLEIDKMQREAAEAPEMAKTRELQRQKLQSDIEKEKREQSGVLLPEQRMKHELAILGDVRQEPAHKQFMEVRNGFQNIQAGKDLDNAQGDLAIINGYAKILDPGSTVREGEFATVGASQGFFERMGVKPATFMKGDRLAPDVRARFLKAGEALAEKKSTSAKEDLQSKYGPIAKRAGLNFDELVPLNMGIGKTAAPAAQSQAITEADIEATMKASGKTRQQVLDAAKAKGFQVP